MLKLLMKIGEVELSWLGHDGFLITNGKRIAIDPYNVHGLVEKADVILITHDHHDHCSIKDIQHLSKKGTIVVGPAHIQSAITKVEGVELHVIEIGDEIELNNVKIEVVPAYNTDKYRDAEKKILYHPKSEGYVGYVTKVGNVVVYHAGDTDLISEMQKLTGHGKQGNHFVALLPVSGTYVMTAEEAAEAAALLKPEIAIPMHYGAGVAGTIEDAQRFVELCRDEGIHAEVLEKT